MKRVPSFTATIYVGARDGYDGLELPFSVTREYLSALALEGGWSFTLAPTEFFYKGGAESGVVVGLINYPRFPESKSHIKRRALKVAKELRVLYHQQRVSVVFPDETVMIEEGD